MKEHDIQNDIRNALAGKAFIFRANVGSGWTGKEHQLPNGDMLLKNLFGPSGGIMDHRLLEIIACPVCNGKLYYSQDKQELICKLDRLAFPLREGIPVLLETEARPLPVEESQS